MRLQIFSKLEAVKKKIRGGIFAPIVNNRHFSLFFPQKSMYSLSMELKLRSKIRIYISSAKYKCAFFDFIRHVICIICHKTLHPCPNCKQIYFFIITIDAGNNVSLINIKVEYEACGMWHIDLIMN